MTGKSRLAVVAALGLLCTAMQMDIRRQSLDSYAPKKQPTQTEPQDTTTMEILPASYLGCWQGMVTNPDTLESLNGCISGPSVPELYTLCYQKTSSGKFQLTFGEVQMDDEIPANYQVIGTASRLEVVSSDGVARVGLRSFIHFDQMQDRKSAAQSTWSMDERTDMACQIKDGNMEVRASFAQTSDGADCFTGTWHTSFRRFDADKKSP